MRRTALWITVALLGMPVVGAWPAQAVITGSAHDFSADGWNPSGQICIVCHTPHNADTSVSNAPLWNHATTTASYSLYTSATLNATVAQPDGISKLCLSCHDGTVALDSFGAQTGSTFIDGGANVGIDLSDDHPVSFVYDSALAAADGGLHDPSTIAPLPLFPDRVECASCHDVHNSFGINKLLRVSNAGSALCLTCHDK